MKRRKKRERALRDPTIYGLALEARRLQCLAGELKDLRERDLWSQDLEKEYQAVLKDLAANIAKRRSGSASASHRPGRPRKA